MDKEFEKIKKEKSLFKKHLLFVKWLNHELLKKNIKELPIIVGGSAVEIYTGGFYVSGDIDLVYKNRKLIEDILINSGYFKKVGKNFISEKLGIFVEIVDENLAGSQNKIIDLNINEEKIKVIGIEDLIIDRLNACVHWKSYSDCEWAEILFTEYKNKIDLNYLLKRAKEENVISKLEEFLKNEDKD